jgi:hypothetical protein
LVGSLRTVASTKYFKAFGGLDDEAAERDDADCDGSSRDGSERWLRLTELAERC